MCSDSESAGGSSESRSMDSPTASPGRTWQESFVHLLKICYSPERHHDTTDPPKWLCRLQCSPVPIIFLMYVFSVTCASQFSGLVYNKFPLKEHPPITLEGISLQILILIKVLVKDADNNTCNSSQIVSVGFIPYWGHLNINIILKA